MKQLGKEPEKLNLDRNIIPAWSNGTEQHKKSQERHTVFQQSAEGWKSADHGTSQVSFIEE